MAADIGSGASGQFELGIRQSSVGTTAGRLGGSGRTTLKAALVRSLWLSVDRTDYRMRIAAGERDSTQLYQMGSCWQKPMGSGLSHAPQVL